MTSKSAIEQAEMLAKEQRKESNAKARHGLFMLLVAIIFGILKILWKIINILFSLGKKRFDEECGNIGDLSQTK